MIDEFEYVVNNSEYVKINYNELDNFINQFNEIKYNHWIKELSVSLDEKKLIILAFIIESMNFCFWKKPKWKIEYKNNIYSGSNALFYSIIKETEKNKDFLDINYLKNLNKVNFKNIFSSIEGEIPLVDERYTSFKDVVSYIYNNNNFYNELFEIKHDKELLKYITDNFKSFDDKSLYKNKTIHFNKRAILLVNDLFYLSSTIKNNIKNVNNLSGCADYGIPRTFRDFGILVYNKELSEIIDCEKEIKHDSNMEIEIRANMLYVIELIKSKLKQKGIQTNSVELDNIIWWIGKKYKKSPTHCTTTIFY